METLQYLLLHHVFKARPNHHRINTIVQRKSVSKPIDNPRRASRLPAKLQRGMEKLTGVNLQNVRVYYNSDKPAQVQAHAYAQGQDIYLAPGQEHHLPHELGHIVQQAKGMVQPTKSVNGVDINDDPALEKHATELGERAMRVG